MRELKTIALVGNPNSGKTSLFNILTGLKQKVANFPGITVDKKTGYFLTGEGQKTELVDLPGTYSLFPKSPDESIPFEILTDGGNPHYPDGIIYILDATNLKRHLLLLTQILDLKVPTIVALNMVDQSTRKGLEIDIRQLEEDLGVKVKPITARNGEGVDELLKAVPQEMKVSDKDFCLPPDHITEMVNNLSMKVRVPSTYTGLLYFHKMFKNTFLSESAKDRIEALKHEYNFDSLAYQRVEVLERYKLIQKIAARSVKLKEGINKYAINEKLDRVLTHRIWGYVIFLGILFLIFQAIFSWSTYPMDLIEWLFAEGSRFTSEIMPNGILKSLLIDGVLAGLSGVVIFIPQIALLFLFITILEDTGYISRVVFLMDKFMRKFGLSGKSVIPLMSGAACAVPAIMATRNIESWKERLITIMVTPLMSCSARIPVYVLLIALVAPSKSLFGVFNLQGVMLMGLYIIGFLASITAAWFFKKFLNIKEKKLFVMELPDYRFPRLKNVFQNAYDKAKSFVLEAGKIILAIAIILWALASFAPGDRFQEIEDKYALEEMGEKERNVIVRSEKLKSSYAGILGRTIEPVIAPLGFDWKIGIAIVTSFAAREVFVGTMATIYGLEGDETDFRKLTQKMRTSRDPVTGEKVYTLATVLSLLIFYAFAMQCMSTLAVTYKETHSWKWPVIQFVFMTGLAYISSFIVYQSIS